MKNTKIIVTLLTATLLFPIIVLASTNSKAAVAVRRYYTTNTGNHSWIPDGSMTTSLARLHYDGVAWTANTTGASKIYMIENPNTGDTLMTSSLGEYNSLKKIGWADYFSVLKVTYSSGNVRVYRLYNPNAGKHFYTTNGGEISSLVKAGWKNEGIKFYVVSGGV